MKSRPGVCNLQLHVRVFYPSIVALWLKEKKKVNIFILEVKREYVVK